MPEQTRTSDRRFHSIECRLDRLEGAEVATQEQVDALTAQVTQIATDLVTATSDLQTEIDNLVAANPTIDLTALTAAVAPIDAAVNALDTLAPVPPVVAVAYFVVTPAPADATVWVAAAFNDGSVPPNQLYTLAAGAVNDGTGVAFTGTPVAGA
jgi:hypothetical protein